MTSISERPLTLLSVSTVTLALGGQQISKGMTSETVTIVGKRTGGFGCYANDKFAVVAGQS